MWGERGFGASLVREESAMRLRRRERGEVCVEAAAILWADDDRTERERMRMRSRAPFERGMIEIEERVRCDSFLASLFFFVFGSRDGFLEKLRRDRGQDIFNIFARESVN